MILLYPKLNVYKLILSKCIKYSKSLDPFCFWPRIIYPRGFPAAFQSVDRQYFLLNTAYLMFHYPELFAFDALLSRLVARLPHFPRIAGDTSKAQLELELRLLKDVHKSIFECNEEEATQNLYNTLLDKEKPMDVSHMLFSLCLWGDSCKFIKIPNYGIYKPKVVPNFYLNGSQEP